MEYILAFAAIALLLVQGQRNYLIIKGYQNRAPEPVEVTLVLPEEYWPTVTVSNDITIDYDKLAAAFNKQEPAIVQVQPVVVNNPPASPTIVPVPQYPQPQYPVIYGETTTSNEIEINGVKGKQFPARYDLKDEV